MKTKYWLPMLLTALLTIVLATGVALAASTTEIVTEDDITRQAESTPPTDNWVLYTRTSASIGTFVVGPVAPPAGIGSIQFETPTGSDKVFLFNYDHVGTPLAAIDAISYATYRSAGSLQQVTALNIQVDYNGSDPDGFTTLVFEPVYNTAQGSVVSGQWQNWDAYAGGTAIWWSTRAINGVCATSCYVSWQTIVSANPNATILGGFGVNQGSGNATLVAAVDALTLGHAGNTIVYDFEPYEVAKTQEQCKNGGWQSVTRADGSPFKNQGDCIQYVNTGK
jgi:hypothetical protein